MSGVTCQDCGEARRHRARGLCDRCYVRNRVAGTLAPFKRLTRSAADTREDYEFLAAQGYSRAHAAERMGITKDGLEKAIERGHSRGRDAA